MSAKATFWAWEQEVKNPSAKLVLLKLADNANDKGLCWPSFTYLSNHTGFNDRTIKRHIKTLAEAGLILITRRKSKDNPSKNETNLYKLNISGSVNMSPPTNSGSDNMSLGVVSNCHEVVTEDHQGSDKFDRRVVSNCHPEPKRESNNESNKREGHSLSPIPEDFEPCETTLIYLKRNGLEPLNSQELQEFIDYYQGEGKLKSNWDAVYRKWVSMQRRNYDKQRGNSHAKQSTSSNSQSNRRESPADRAIRKSKAILEETSEGDEGFC